MPLALYSNTPTERFLVNKMAVLTVCMSDDRRSYVWNTYIYRTVLCTIFNWLIHTILGYWTVTIHFKYQYMHTVCTAEYTCSDSPRQDASRWNTITDSTSDQYSIQIAQRTDSRWSINVTVRLSMEWFMELKLVATGLSGTIFFWCRTCDHSFSHWVVAVFLWHIGCCIGEIVLKK